MANLIFDYDGTLHESLYIYAPSFRLGYSDLVRRGLAADIKFSDDGISQWLGFSVKDMWESFMPELPQHERALCGGIIGDEMIRLTLSGKAKLYPGAETVLRQLRDSGHNLIFLSNCKRSYMRVHHEYFKLGQYFSDFYCTEDFDFKPKWQIAESVLAKVSGQSIVIGDRLQDIEIALHNQLPSIGCAFGYCKQNELKNATIQVFSAEDILPAIEKCV
ncbi:MAG: HAD hydrolase-like protein [Eubacteriales bacterium]|nr:HAD hydrolase-like protein [Eubacteriales bacterium]MDD4389838.1 HAD hydrolase-like protein [Eubacteriales bacterium]